MSIEKHIRSKLEKSQNKKKIQNGASREKKDKLPLKECQWYNRGLLCSRCKEKTTQRYLYSNCFVEL